jgi:hypothetical protein
MFTERQNLILKKLNMRTYLELLSALTGRVVVENELCSFEEVQVLHQKKIAASPQQATIHKTAFSDLCSTRFSEFIEKLRHKNPTPVFIWTDQTIHCGALTLNSINRIIDLNFTTLFDGEGVITFVTPDRVDSLLFDFELSPDGEKILEIETRGSNWFGVTY